MEANSKMFKLRLEFSPKEYPCTNGTIPLVYGVLSLILYDLQDNQYRVLDGLIWDDLEELPNWLLENRNEIFFTEFPTKYRVTGLSIAENVFNFYDSDIDFEDGDYDLMYKYRNTHGLRFGLRGTDLANIYIGLNENHYEVSFCDVHEKWVYEIDIKDFFKHIEELRISNSKR